MARQDLIEALGGIKAVAAELNTTPSAVANWRLQTRSIPWRFRPILAKIAAERAITLPEDFWGEAA